MQLKKTNQLELRCAEIGATLPFLAITILALFLLIALSLNIGWIASVHSQAQAAVDAAALAGAAAIPDYHIKNGDMTNLIALSTSFNGATNQPDTNEVANSGPDIQTGDIALKVYDGVDIKDPQTNNPLERNAVQVTKNYEVPLFFTKLINTITWNISVTATANMSGPSCFKPDLPLALIDDSATTALCQPLNCGTEVTYALQSPSTLDTSSFFNFDGEIASASRCRDMVNNGMGSKMICAGDNIALNNGQVTSCLSDMENKCTSLACSPGNPWIVDIPVVSSKVLQSGNPNQSAPIAGFARIGITEVNDHGSPKYIKFNVMCNQVSPDTAAGGTTCGLLAQKPILIK